VSNLLVCQSLSHVRVNWICQEIASAVAYKEEYVHTQRSGVWLLYLREKKGQKAKCKECSLIVKCEGGCSGLHTHQRTKHSNNLLKRSSVETPKRVNNDDTKVTMKEHNLHHGSPMTKYLLDTKERSLGATISRMAAHDGLSFKVVAEWPKGLLSVMLIRPRCEVW
jgi:radical SAM protein with 4Fe4S-binding SPASM domain